MQMDRRARNVRTKRERERERERGGGAGERLNFKLKGKHYYCLCAHYLRNVGVSYVHDVIYMMHILV